MHLLYKGFQNLNDILMEQIFPNLDLLKKT